MPEITFSKAKNQYAIIDNLQFAINLKKNYPLVINTDPGFKLCQYTFYWVLSSDVAEVLLTAFLKITLNENFFFKFVNIEI
jgi:hypothetical protein